jgi:aminopeptidase N
MKFLKVVGSLILGFSASSAVAQSEYSCQRIKGHDNSEERSARLSDHYIGLTQEYDVHFYNLVIDLERTSTYISGDVQIHVEVTSAEMDTFLFELWDDFVIDEILLNGVTPMPFTRIESAVIVPYEALAGDNFYLQVSYEGLPPTGGGPLGGGGMTNDESPSWGNQVTWSLSEPFAAYEWFPCKQLLTDKIDSVYINVTTSAENMAGSNGLLTAVVDLPGDKKRYEWKTYYPIAYYLISVAVAEYVDYSIYANPIGAAEPILIQNFIYNNPLTLPYFEDDINETVDFLEHYSELYGMYPFANEKYGHCMAPLGGGMEHQTMTTQGFFERTLTAHELGHQWFGDNVTCASWSDIWLNEGFASYSEELMLAEFYPGDEVTSMADRHENIKGEAGGSVWVEDSLSVGRIFDGRLTYNKGAAIVHTFRFLINDDEVFFDILQTYQETYKDSTAVAADFKEIAETISGVDLTAFFNEWYYGEGYPTYSIEYAQVGGELIVVLDQTTSMPGVTPFFTNDLAIRVQKVGGGSEIVRMTGIDSEHTVHVFPISGEATSITIDPGNWIINNNGSIDENLNLAELSEEKSALTIYPNPANSILTVENDQNASTYQLIDAQGKTVLIGVLGIGVNSIDVSELPAGHYFIRMNGNQSTFTKI